MNSSYFILICEETDVFDGKVIHINQKTKDLNEAHQIVENNITKYPNSRWELYPCSIEIPQPNN